jgi:hypothetical protein
VARVVGARVWALDVDMTQVKHENSVGDEKALRGSPTAKSGKAHPLT